MHLCVNAMMHSPEFYTHKLYPLQDRALRAMQACASDFYLTGGTALSRASLHHRYSDDLDFFCNAVPDFNRQVELCLAAIRQEFGKGLEVSITTESYLRAFVREGKTDLKIEFVNDVPFRSGEVERTDLFYRTDTVRNILSNKLSALQRHEPKDVADLIHICRSTDFHWRDVVGEAKQKDLWVDEAELVKLLSRFSVLSLGEVRWAVPFDLAVCAKDISALIHDLSLGKTNSLKA